MVHEAGFFVRSILLALTLNLGLVRDSGGYFTPLYSRHILTKREQGRGLALNNRLIFGTTALGLLMIANSFNGFNPAMGANQSVQEVVEAKQPSMTTEEYVRNYFSDIPVMIEVARCESRFRQHQTSGNVLRGEKNPLDRGVMQINEHYHGEDAERLGFDILTIEGNTAYARYLYDKYGVRPWKSSAACWAKTLAYDNFITDRTD